jgi:hypothetical protein
MVSELQPISPSFTMASSASSSNPISAPSNYSQFVTVKLTRDNYLLWQAQILPYLRCQRLHGYITGATPCPSQTLPAPEKDAEPVPNPAYEQWYEQDKAIISAILSSLSPEVLSQCLFLKTSYEVWNKLDSLYCAQSRASAMQIRMQLATIKKQDLSATDYYNRVKHLADTLAVIGAPLHDDEIVAYLLTGLPEEYDPLVTSVTARADPMSLGEVYTNLLSFEMRLIQRHRAPTAGHVLVANYSSRGGHGGRNGGRFAGRSMAAMEVALAAVTTTTVIALIVPIARSMAMPITKHHSAGTAMTTATRRMTSPRLHWRQRRLTQ